MEGLGLDRRYRTMEGASAARANRRMATPHQIASTTPKGPGASEEPIEAGQGEAYANARM
jgi:hypothetical protein